MDRFARNYLIGLTAVIVLVVGWNWLSRDTRVAEINAQLAGDAELADYPFRFQVMSLNNGVATVGSPRTARVPAMQFLRAAFPELSRTAVDHPDMMAAQDLLAKKQSRAAELIRGQPDVSALRWVLDERWFREHGVFLDLEP